MEVAASSMGNDTSGEPEDIISLAHAKRKFSAFSPPPPFFDLSFCKHTFVFFMFRWTEMSRSRSGRRGNEGSSLEVNKPR